jgi:hypothetical protein
MSKNLERYQKSWSHAVKNQTAVLSGFGFVFASAFAKATADRQSQALHGPAERDPSLSLAKTPKTLAAAQLHHFFKHSAPTERLQHFFKCQGVL